MCVVSTKQAAPSPQGDLKWKIPPSTSTLKLLFLPFIVANSRQTFGRFVSGSGDTRSKARSRGGVSMSGDERSPTLRERAVVGGSARQTSQER